MGTDEILQALLDDLGVMPIEIDGRIRLVVFTCLNCQQYSGRFNAWASARCNGKNYQTDRCRLEFKAVDLEAFWLSELLEAYRR